MVSTPVLATKLFPPARRRQLVARPRVAGRLDTTLDPGHRLTLVSAPAGFGKTTLLSGWLADLDQRQPDARVGWLSLDENDNDLTRFMTHLVAGLQSVELEVDAAVLESLSTAPATEALTALVNDVARAGEQKPGRQWIVVLDDYHAIEAPEVHEAVIFLLDYLPDHLHLIMATRSDPPLPLARLRSRGQLSEVRAADLRFTPSEARDFLNQVMGLELTTADVDALEDRTEGWIAGLQLAALSLRGITQREEIADFIQAFTGSNRFVIDYLADEVLARQPRQIATSCSVPPSSIASTDRCATPSPAAPTAAGRWRTWSAATCSLSRSTPSAPGTATTTCSPTYSTHACSPSTRTGAGSACARQRLVRRPRPGPGRNPARPRRR